MACVCAESEAWQIDRLLVPMSCMNVLLLVPNWCPVVGPTRHPHSKNAGVHVGGKWVALGSHWGRQGATSRYCASVFLTVVQSLTLRRAWWCPFMLDGVLSGIVSCMLPWPCLTLCQAQHTWTVIMHLLELRCLCSCRCISKRMP